MKLIKNSGIFLSCIILLMACKKDLKQENMPDYGISFLKKPDSIPTPNNYVVVYYTRTVNALDPGDKYSSQVNVFARFSENGTDRLNRGNLMINNQVIAPGADNSYQFVYSGKSYEEGKALIGKKAAIELQGNNQFAATKSAIKMPKELIKSQEVGLVTPIVYNFPTSTVERNSNLSLTWVPDPDNEFHQVQVQITYCKGISQYNNPSMPNSIESLVYTVSDYGFFTIPQADLARFPTGSYVELSILRASTDNTGNIAYLSVAEAHSVPLVMVTEISLLAANFTLSTSSSNPCSYTATAQPSGGYPGYNCTWFTHTIANPTPVEVGYGYVLTGTGSCASSQSASANYVPPVGDQDTYITLTVNDQHGNTASITKLLKFTMPIEYLTGKKSK